MPEWLERALRCCMQRPSCLQRPACCLPRPAHADAESSQPFEKAESSQPPEAEDEDTKDVAPEPLASPASASGAEEQQFVPAKIGVEEEEPQIDIVVDRSEVTLPTPRVTPRVMQEDVLKMTLAEAVNCLREKLHDEELCAACCGRIRVICRDDSNCGLADQLGAFKVIVAALNKHLGRTELAKQGCAAIVNICAGADETVRQNAASERVLPMIVQTMGKLSNDPLVQEMAFVALQNVTYSVDPLNLERKSAAVQGGAVRAVVAAMKRFPDLTGLQEQGVATLRLLVSKSKDLRRKAKDQGARSDWLGSSGGLLSSRFPSISRLSPARSATKKPRTTSG